MNGHSLTIVGVAPPRFNGTMPVLSADLWLPFGAAALVTSAEDVSSPGRFVNDRSVQTLLLAGTLRQGTSIAAAESRLAALAASFEAAFPQCQRRSASGRARAIAGRDRATAPKRCGARRRRRGLDGPRRPRAAGRVPQSRQHPPRARSRPASGDRHSSRTGWCSRRGSFVNC